MQQNLLRIWPETSKSCKFIEKIYYNYGDTEFFTKGLFFIGTPCRATHVDYMGQHQKGQAADTDYGYC